MIHSILDIDFAMVGIVGSIALLHVGLLWFMPRLTRPDLYFAVTVDPGFRDRPEARSILARYRSNLIIFSGLALIAWLTGSIWLGAEFVYAGLIIQLLAGFFAFSLARKRTLPYAVAPSTIRETEVRVRDHIIPGGWLAAAAPFGLLIAGIVFIQASGLNGEVAHSGIHGLTVYLLRMAGVLLLLTLILYGHARWVRPVHAGGPEHVQELKFRRTVSAIVLAAEYYIVLQTLWIVLVPGHRDLVSIAFLPLIFVFLFVMIAMLVRTGQGGSRLSASEPPSPASGRPIGDRTPDRYWKLGIFYFNRDDAAVFIEKRFGIGYSLNFARPMAWIIVLIALSAPLVPILACLSRILPKSGG